MFDPRTRAEIAESYLDTLASRYAALGQTLDTSVGSDPEMLAGALALLLEAYDAQAVAQSKEILPDQASESGVLRHGAVEGLPREPAVAAVLSVTVTGTASATVTFGSATLTATDGAGYTVSANADGTGPSVVLSGGGTATAYARAQTAGAAGSRPTGTILAWSSAPANANPTATVVAIVTAGADVEAVRTYARRIIARRQERPASGNRADWLAWMLEATAGGAVDGVVYPLLHPTYGVGTYGAVTGIPLGPAQGDSAANTRILSAPAIDLIEGYVEGTLDADGGTSGTLEQKRPVAMAPGSYSIEAAVADPRDVELLLTLAPAYAPPWAYDAALLVVNTPPTNTTLSLAGDRTALLKPAGVIQPILAKIRAGGGATVVTRGDYYLVTPTSVTYNGGTSTTDFVLPALPSSAIPVSGSVVLPPPVPWAEIRTTLFAFFDALGPGDTTPASRWPGEDSRLRSKLYRSALAGALVARYDADGALVAGVAGVLSVDVVAPGADVQPAAKAIVCLRTLTARA